MTITSDPHHDTLWRQRLPRPPPDYHDQLDRRSYNHDHPSRRLDHHPGTTTTTTTSTTAP